MAIVKCNWSGGKDSSCATHLHLTQGDKCIVCCYVPMFTEEIPLILKQHYEFILQTAERFKSMGAEVHIVSGITYVEYVTKFATRGKNKGKPFGFPCFIRGQCGFKRDSKEKAIKELTESLELKYDYEDIGIAFDEKDRHNQLNDKKRSILVETKRTEYDATVYCVINGLYSPHYQNFKRDGCVLCANAKSKERQEWFKQYPEAFPILLNLQDFIKAEKPNFFPLRNYRWFIEEDLQMNMFDKGTRWIIN